MGTNRPERRVVVVDDSRTIQAILDNAFSKRPDFNVVGFAADATTAATLIRSAMPDVVTIDLCMPYLDGEALLGMIADLHDVCKVVVSDRFLHHKMMETKLLEAGASLCLSKTELIDDPYAFFRKINVTADAVRNRKRPGGETGGNGLRRTPASSTASRKSPYPIPTDERQRIAFASRKGLFNATREAKFDQITKNTAKLTGFPVALLTFIDRDTQWVKSAYGMEVESTPRDQAFCNYTISQEGVFCVANAAKDDRFADNPLVTGAPCIRTYTGVPITVGDGVTVGSLCVIDTRVRTVSPHSLDQMTALADIVATMIDLRPAMAA